MTNRDLKPIPVPPVHEDYEDCNCEQVGYAEGWNAALQAALASPASEAVSTELAAKDARIREIEHGWAQTTARMNIAESGLGRANAELERVRTALEQYANPKNWMRSYTTDGGMTGFRALFRFAEAHGFTLGAEALSIAAEPARRTFTDLDAERVVRAFWRRIQPYVAERHYESELPYPCPVEFAAHMGTALMALDLAAPSAQPEQ